MGNLLDGEFAFTLKSLGIPWECRELSFNIVDGEIILSCADEIECRKFAYQTLCSKYPDEFHSILEGMRKAKLDTIKQELKRAGWKNDHPGK